VADRYLLTLDDLPSGWSPSPADDSNSSASSTSDPAGCSSDPTEFKAGDEATIQFQQSTFGPFLVHLVARYDNPSAAEDAFTAVTSLINRCQTFTETAADGTVTAYTFSPLSFDSYGDETFATVLHATSGSFPVEGNFVFFRQGAYIDGIGALGLAAAPQVDLAELVTKAAAKLP